MTKNMQSWLNNPDLLEEGGASYTEVQMIARWGVSDQDIGVPGYSTGPRRMLSWILESVELLSAVITMK